MDNHKTLTEIFAECESLYRERFGGLPEIFFNVEIDHSKRIFTPLMHEQTQQVLSEFIEKTNNIPFNELNDVILELRDIILKSNNEFRSALEDMSD